MPKKIVLMICLLLGLVTISQAKTIDFNDYSAETSISRIGDVTFSLVGPDGYGDPSLVLGPVYNETISNYILLNSNDGWNYDTVEILRVKFDKAVTISQFTFNNVGNRYGNEILFYNDSGELFYSMSMWGPMAYYEYFHSSATTLEDVKWIDFKVGPNTDATKYFFGLQNIVYEDVDSSSASKTLFDDFTGNRIDYEKWGNIDSEKEIFIKDGQLYGAFTGYAQSTGYDYQNLPFVNPESVDAIKAMVTIHDASSTDVISGKVQLGGHFYSDQYGDVWVEIAINKTEEDLYASWGIHSNGSGQGLAGGILKDDLQLGTAYGLSLSYNADDNLFTFSIDEDTATSEGINKQGVPSAPWKTIDFGVCCGSYEGPAGISASIDNVYINNEDTVYDDFSSTTIDTTKWDTNSSKHTIQIENNTLHLVAQGNDIRTSTNIWPILDNSQYLEAEITVNENTYVSTGAKGKIRIGRSFYNDTYGPEIGLNYDGELGNVWGEIQIGIADDNSLTAYAQAYRVDDPDWNTDTTLIDQAFSTSIQSGENYTISIEFIGEQLVFFCNDETITYDIETSTYEIQDNNFYITSRVYLDQGEEGIFDATIDNIYIKENIDEERINWSYIGINGNEISVGFSVYEEFADQISSAVLTGPGSFSGSFDLIADYDDSSNKWQAKFGTSFSYGTYTFTVSFLDGVEKTYDRELTITVLTDTTLSKTVSSNETATIYGTLEENSITIESGGSAKLINFPANNTITIQENSELFAVSRAGANVTFESTSGTIIQIPANSSIQNIIFNDRTMNLTVNENQVMLGNQIIDLNSSPIEGKGNSFIYIVSGSNGSIKKFNTETGNYEELSINELESPYGITADDANQKIYWTDYTSDKIFSADFDGSDVQEVISDGLNFPSGVAIDGGNNKIYWADYGNSTIKRADIDGTNIEILLDASQIDAPLGMSLDVNNEYIYFTDEGTKKVQRIDFDGSNLTDIAVDLPMPHGIVYSPKEGKLFWTNWIENSGSVQCANADGSNVTTIVNNIDWGMGITIDSSNDKIYYSTGSEVRSCNYNGSDDKLTLATSQSPFIVYVQE